MRTLNVAARDRPLLLQEHPWRQPFWTNSPLLELLRILHLLTVGIQTSVFDVQLGRLFGKRVIRCIKFYSVWHDNPSTQISDEPPSYLRKRPKKTANGGPLDS